MSESPPQQTRIWIGEQFETLTQFLKETISQYLLISVAGQINSPGRPRPQLQKFPVLLSLSKWSVFKLKICDAFFFFSKQDSFPQSLSNFFDCLLRIRFKDDPVINSAIFRALYLGYLVIQHIFDV